MTLWKELIEIPERVHKSDFVLNLADGLERPEQTIRDYVVPDELAESFELALSIVKGAIEAGKSRAVYLHGSFGSGKSHFMAVLDLLLSGNPQARSIKALAPVVAKYDTLDGKRFLMVPYHMVGARNMESAILGGYVDFVKRRHPDAPIPAVFLAEEVFENAEKLREQMGHEALLAMLNAGTEKRTGWGKRAQSWTRERYDDAMTASPGSRERTDLVSDLVAHVFPSLVGVARSGGGDHTRSETEKETFVSLDAGLAIISRHAQELGYDAVILFLDELILWLASRAGDMPFLTREGQKLSKLVEAQHAQRPVPVISFVARQRDIREFVGESHTGSEFRSLTDSIQWWEGRFETVTLEDRNLPVIVQQRLLKPKDSADNPRIQQSFELTLGKMRKDEIDIVLGSTADRNVFAQSYPFSPALLHTLVALSAFLQRERTALRLMSMLLVRNRRVLELGDIVPVGDLWDVVAEGEEPFSDAMRAQFQAAKRLYEQRLRPLLVHENGIDPLEYRNVERTELSEDVRQKLRQFRNDDRLAKTLLLAQLVPEVEAFSNLTARKLHALNWGAVRSRVRGAEASQVVAKLKKWSRTVGELRIGDEADPKVSLQLSGVDLEQILSYADTYDNPGNRKRLVRELLFKKMGVDTGDGLFSNLRLDWKGGQRDVHIGYCNIRDRQDDDLLSDGVHWKVIVDYPFDEPSYSPQDDRQRLDQFRQTHPEGTETIAWLPSFISNEGKNLLGRLIKVEHVLKRFDEATAHISSMERPVVKSQLEAQQNQLGTALEHTLLVAYGLADEDLDTIDPNLDIEEHVVSLAAGHNPKQPGSATFANGLREIVEEALSHKYPNAYALPNEHLTKGKVIKLLEALVATYEQPENRWGVEDRSLRVLLHQYIQPMGLAEMGETHLVKTDIWQARLEQELAKKKAPVTVERLRKILDPPDKPTGLPKLLQDLNILLFATVSNCSLRQAGLRLEGGIGDLPAGAELVPEALPDEADWEKAKQSLQHVFGIVESCLLNARNAGRVAAKAEQTAKALADSANLLPEVLMDVGTRVGLTEEAISASNRYRTAVSAEHLVRRLKGTPKKVLEALGRAELNTSPQAVGRSLKSAENVLAALQGARWQGIDYLVKNEDTLDVDGKNLLRQIREYLLWDELAIGGQTSFEALEEQALNALAKASSQPVEPVAQSATWSRTVANRTDLNDVFSKLVANVDKGIRMTVRVTEEDDG